MSYESYKVIHFAAIFVFLSSASVLLLARPAGKAWKMITGLSSFVILVAGMGLLARIGGGLPLWVQVKMVIWLAITGLGHLVAKRFPAQAAKAYMATLALATLAAWLAVYKPF
ncbi:MAG TPA: hypothetical protein VIH99_03055 [Bdellovibrionota bacterium]|jgi:hypothetical protein